MCVVLAAKEFPLTKFSFKCQAVYIVPVPDTLFNAFRFETLPNTRVRTLKARLPSATIPTGEIYVSAHKHTLRMCVCDVNSTVVLPTFN